MKQEFEQKNYIQDSDEVYAGSNLVSTDGIEVLTHSSIRIKGEKSTLYVDPFQIEEEYHDADLILITHDHFDHFSPDDMKKVMKRNTSIIVPEKMKDQVAPLRTPGGRLVTVVPGIVKELEGVIVETVAAYNNIKPFHPKMKGWVGYVIRIDDKRIYVAGDTDMNKDNQRVSCNIAMVPIGGKYTMDAKHAAEFVNVIKPKVAIPTHYGSIAGKKEDEDVFKEHVNPFVRVEVKMQKY